MTTVLAITVTSASIQPVIKLVTDSVTSDHTKRAYSRALTDFVVWHSSTGQQGSNKATVQAHVTALRAQGISAK